jgi:hypothetical protein
VIHPPIALQVLPLNLTSQRPCPECFFHQTFYIYGPSSLHHSDIGVMGRANYSPRPSRVKKVRPVSNPLYVLSESFFCSELKHNHAWHFPSFSTSPYHFTVSIEHEQPFYQQCRAFYTFTTSVEPPLKGVTAKKFAKQTKGVRRLPSIHEAKEPIETDATAIIYGDSRVHVNGDKVTSSGNTLSITEDEAKSPLSRQTQVSIDAICTDSPHAANTVSNQYPKLWSIDVRGKEQLDNCDIGPAIHIHSVTSQHLTETLNESKEFSPPIVQLSSSLSAHSDGLATAPASNAIYPHLSKRIDAQTHSNTSLVDDSEYFTLRNAEGGAKYVHRMGVKLESGTMGHAAYDHTEKIRPLRMNTSKMGTNGVYIVPKVYLPNGMGHARTVSEPMADLNGSNHESIESVRRSVTDSNRGVKIGRIPPHARIPNGVFPQKPSPSNSIEQTTTPAVRKPPPTNRPYRRTSPQNINSIPNVVPLAPTIQAVSSEPVMPSTGIYTTSSHVQSTSSYPGSRPIVITNPPISPPQTPPTSTEITSTNTTRVALPFADRRPETPPNRLHSPTPSQKTTVISTKHTSPIYTSQPLPPAPAIASPSSLYSTRISQTTHEQHLLTEHLRREGLLSQIIFPASSSSPSLSHALPSPHLSPDRQRKRTRSRYFMRPDLRRSIRAKRTAFTKAKIWSTQVRAGIQRNRGKVSYVRIRVTVRAWGRRVFAWGRRVGGMGIERGKRSDGMEGMEFMCRGT